MYINYYSFMTVFPRKNTCKSTLKEYFLKKLEKFEVKIVVRTISFVLYIQFFLLYKYNIFLKHDT